MLRKKIIIIVIMFLFILSEDILIILLTGLCLERVAVYLQLLLLNYYLFVLMKPVLCYPKHVVYD